MMKRSFRPRWKRNSEIHAVGKMNPGNQNGITLQIAEQDDAVGCETAERETAGTSGLLVRLPSK